MVVTVEQLTGAALAGLLTKNEIPAAPASAKLSDLEQKGLGMDKTVDTLLQYHKERRRAT